MRAFVLAAAALALCACIHSYAQEVEDTRTGLVGLSGKDLRRCLGAPQQVDIVEDVEQQTYRFAPQNDPWVSSNSNVGGVTIGTHASTIGGPGDTLRPDRSETPAFCQLDFELRQGRVTQVSAHGRDAHGLNASASCLLAARRCLPDETEDSE